MRDTADAPTVLAPDWRGPLSADEARQAFADMWRTERRRIIDALRDLGIPRRQRDDLARQLAAAERVQMARLEAGMAQP